MQNTNTWRKFIEKECLIKDGVVTVGLGNLEDAFIKVEKEAEQRGIQRCIDIAKAMLERPEEIEQKHQEEFRKDEAAFRINPSEINLTKMKLHEGTTAQYFGGRNQGYIQALKDLLSSLQDNNKDL